ncbi:hypothetical protein KUTeg_011184 [Tegillarca granosa]|uniref:Uncharacterized protein n=1 Tax=Tegillarca granosa TaxID=220873 RepID=A0ABQ9F4V8_TEGGR|nr:hypothetical protein KUTeg_011184 [Tegillarca granosa]
MFDIMQYLCDESLDKKKTKFDLTGWTTDIAKKEILNVATHAIFQEKNGLRNTDKDFVTMSQKKSVPIQI